MASESPPVVGPELQDKDVAASSSRWRVRIRFEKAGDLRFVSHHDLMHCFERMFRRVGLPLLTSQGFNPKPRMVFAQSLALGLVGRAEVLDLELDEPMSAEVIQHRMAGKTPPGLTILSVRAIDPRTRVQVRRAFYRVEVPAERRADLPRIIDELLAASTCWVDRTRPQPRRLDLRPYLGGLHVAGSYLEMALWVTPNGAARPDEVLQLLGLADLIAAGAVVERTGLELHDEVSPGAEGGAAPAPPSVRPADHISITEPSTSPGPLPASRAEVEPPSRPTSLIPGPLSFES